MTLRSSDFDTREGATAFAGAAVMSGIASNTRRSAPQSAHYRLRAGRRARIFEPKQVISRGRDVMPDSSSWMGDLRRNRYRVLLWSSLCAALAIAVWLSGAGSWLPAERERPQPPGRSGEEALLAMAPADLPVAVRERYRLQPDRRLLAAVAAVHRLRTGAKPETVKTEWVDGLWRILAGSDEVGVLSELPGFEEATDLLARWASGLPSAPAVAGPSGSDLTAVERSVQAVDAAALLQVLSSLGGSPADVQRDPAKMRSITSGLAWLSTMTVDHLEQGDALLGEAWAWVVIERASGAPRGGASEALVARALGYEAAAARAAASLVQDDPVRLYAESDEARLGALCARRKTDRSCHFLRLALLAERSQDERFRAALQGSPFRNERSLALRGLETRLSDFDGGNAGSDLAELAVQAVSLPVGPDEASAEARTRDFEAAVGRLASHGGL